MIEAIPFRNTSFAGVTPLLSVLIPFYKESPLRLLEALATRDPHQVEVIVLDDGSAMPGITAEIEAFVARSPLACQLITLSANEGRSRGRNRLTRAARGEYFLFLDADMLPDSIDFVDRWLAVATDRTAVAFGGFSLLQASADPATAVHRLMAAHSDCLSAEVRNQQPEKYVFTSNLLVRRDVFAAETFDPEFSGWGWEDTEWGMRVAARYGVIHVENAATHLGLDTAATLAHKYEQSVPNFKRVLSKHRDVVSAYPSYRVARMLRFVPFLPVWRPLMKQAALVERLPAKLRAFALRLYRAALYAQVVS